ncbi:MAG: SurA N-terminal domain-containing protein [Xanthomonadales bacterium]|nr:SurA N-terminal domain-containing protein [Xanthomonadales bacterium]
MLQKIREKATGIIGIIIVVLLSLTFALWGIQNYVMGASDPVVATINDITITRQQFESRFGEYRQQLASQGVDVSFLDDPVRRREFLESMIQEEVWLQAAAAADLDVAPSQIRDEIRKIGAFQVSGTFDPDVYLQLLQLRGMTPADFEQLLRRQLLTQQISGAITSSQFSTPSATSRLATLQDQKRSFRYVVISGDSFEDSVEPTEEEIMAYFEANRSRYREPEKVTIEYLEVRAEDYAGELAVDEQMLRDRYEAEKNRFRVPERRLASHILVEVPEDADEETVAAAEARAAELAAEAQANPEAFPELARESSDDFSASEGGDLGWVAEGDMVEAFEDALFVLEEGAVSDPVRSSFGFHVIYLRDIEEPRGKTFEEAREELAAEFRDAEAERQFLDLQSQLEERLNYSDLPDMAAVAEEFGLELRVLGPFSRAGGSGLTGNPQIVNVAFSELVLEDGLVSDPVILEPNHIVFLRVIDHQEAYDKPLEEVRAQVEEAVREQAARDAARERAEALLAQVEAGDTTLAEIADQSEDIVLETAAGVERSAIGYPAELVRSVFELPRPAGEGPDFHLVPFRGNQFALVGLESVSEPDPASVGEGERTALSRRLARSFSAAEVAALNEALREAANVQVIDEVLNSSP